MEYNYRELIEQLIADPNKLREKKPFTRGMERDNIAKEGETIEAGNTINASLPNIKRYIVSQERFIRELDPFCHDVLFDDNIPSICVKLDDNNYKDVIYRKMALPFQRIIKDKQVMHLSANPMQFTMMDEHPSDKVAEDFITFKQYWDLRNQDGMKTKFVNTQLSYGDAGLLYYFDRNGECKSRILSFSDGYILCPHNDDNGDRILESVYYMRDNIEYIDSYDDEYMYRHTFDSSSDKPEWKLEMKIHHGFDEIPLITKRGKVAWDNVQTTIESYEELYNVFNVIQKRHGWGMLYIKGKFKDKAQKLNGSVILNDTSIEGNGDAKYLAPPSPQGMLETLELMKESIQLGSSTTFLLPKDVKMSGDISGIAIMLTQSLDIENALQMVIEYQNVADKMTRLFKYGIAKERVAKGLSRTAITDFAKLNINAKFKVWRPLNETEYNQMLIQLSGAGLLSKESGIELNTVAKPDEKSRVQKEVEILEEKEKQKMVDSMQMRLAQQNPNERQVERNKKEE